MTPSAAEVVARCARVYAACSTYRDRGEVHRTYRGASSARELGVRVPFQTAFVRPHRFLFEFRRARSGRETEGWEHRALWRDARGVHAWAAQRDGSSRRLELTPSIEHVLADWRSPSAEASHTAPQMLGLSSGVPFGRAPDAFELAARDEIDGRPAWRLASASFGFAGLWWIDVERGLLLRAYSSRLATAEREQRFAPETEGAGWASGLEADVERELALESRVTIETTTFYRPELDVEIPDGAFELHPPD
ncbi:MAG: hypothetical protein IT454_11970 [Planctomycetes bacterium]|nr:hypothetical protein [Planctomycetota bacterium]